MEDNVGSGNHSDSDTSSESWTFVEPTIPNAESQDSAINSSDDNSQESVPVENVLTEQVQEEVDTDGVAVITDDEEVSSTVTETCPPWYPPLPQRGSLDSLYSASIGARPRDPDTVSTTTFRDSEEELPEDFYLADEKIKSYVHRRNNKVSNVLNIVLLGTVVTAVTLAVGFMWGINDTCSLDMLNSVNKILSNLQKLQHENDILKSKIKMLQFMQHNRPIKDPYFQHQMLETNIFDNPQNMDIHFHSTNGPVGSSPHKPVYHYMDGKDAYLELNESEDETYLDSENVSKQATEGEKISKIINGNESPSMGPRTYNQYREDKFKYKNDCRSSGKIHSSSKIKSSGKVDSSGKMDSSSKKDSSGKRDSSGKNKEPNSEKYDKKKDKKLKRENSDWYHKMYNARKVFRERGFDDYTFGGRNKANWYFRRMNDREKHREGEGPSIKKRQKEYFKSKQ